MHMLYNMNDQKCHRIAQYYVILLIKPERHGNRGKRWASQLSRLLEAMQELEDSRPFREPVDCHQYPVCTLRLMYLVS